MRITNVLAGIAVKDFEAAAKWYTRLLGRAPDLRRTEGVVEWRFADGGWLQVFADAERAGHSTVTFVESDLERRLATLGSMDLVVKDIARTEFVDTARFRDPEGNLITFAMERGPVSRVVS